MGETREEGGHIILRGITHLTNSTIVLHMFALCPFLVLTQKRDIAMHSAKDTLRTDRCVLAVREGWARRVCAIAIATKSIASKTRRAITRFLKLGIDY